MKGKDWALHSGWPLMKLKKVPFIEDGKIDLHLLLESSGGELQKMIHLHSHLLTPERRAFLQGFWMGRFLGGPKKRQEEASEK